MTCCLSCNNSLLSLTKSTVVIVYHLPHHHRQQQQQQQQRHTRRYYYHSLLDTSCTQGTVKHELDSKVPNRLSSRSCPVSPNLIFVLGERNWLAFLNFLYTCCVPLACIGLAHETVLSLDRVFKWECRIGFVWPSDSHCSVTELLTSDDWRNRTRLLAGDNTNTSPYLKYLYPTLYRSRSYSARRNNCTSES